MGPDSVGRSLSHCETTTFIIEGCSSQLFLHPMFSPIIFVRSPHIHLDDIELKIIIHKKLMAAMKEMRKCCGTSAKATVCTGIQIVQ